MEPLARLLQAAADPTRLRILHLLHAAGTEVCGCELVDSLEIPQYNLSKHLKILREAGLVVSRKEGQWVYYGLPRDRTAESRALIRMIAGAPTGPVGADDRRLRKRLSQRIGGKCLLSVQNAALLPRTVPRRRA